MASANRSNILPAGTVASRVQTIQNASALGHSPVFSRAPRVMTRAQEAGTTFGHGRRTDSSFGSPAGRASRDGNEGLRGDGRPPVGNFKRIVNSSLEKEVVLHPPRLALHRPATSLDIGNDDRSSSNDIAPFCGIRALHKPRSMENLAPPSTTNNEISQVRAKLRSVKRPTTSHPTSTEGQKVKPDPAGHEAKCQNILDSQDILNELDGLLVGALERAKTTGGSEFDKIADCTTLTSSTEQSTTPQQLFRRNSSAMAGLAAVHPRLHSSSPHRRETTDESLKLGRGTDADLADFIEMPADDGPPQRPLNREQDQLPMPTFLEKGPSPVKARAALFEKMYYRVPGDLSKDRHSRGRTITKSTVRSMRKKLETENSSARSTHTPPIELALPQLISHPRRHSKQSSVSGHSESCQYGTAKESAVVSPSVTQPEEDRKVSVPWPFKWNLFPHDKATPAPPKPSGVEAKAKTGHDEHVRDSSMEHIANHICISPAKLALSPKRKPGVVSGETQGQVNSPRERKKVVMDEGINKTVVPQDMQDLLTEADLKTPQKNRQRTDLISTQFMTPSKPSTPPRKPLMAASSPHTPFRGRARSGHRESYVVEQRYSVSRSRSRGGVKILVEVSSPDPSPSRTNDDTVIIIRANVDPLEE